MADNDDVSGSVDPGPEPSADAGPGTPESATAPLPAQSAPDSAAAAPVLKTRWRDRAWSFRAMLAVALATFLIGGIAGGVVVAASDQGDRDMPSRMGQWGPGGMMRGPGGMMRGPRWKMRDPRGFNGGGPGWRWDDGPEPPELTPYDGTTPTPPTTTPAG